MTQAAVPRTKKCDRVPVMVKNSTDNSDPVRLAVIGAGFIGTKHLQTIAQESAARLVAIADPAPAAKEVGRGYGVEVFADTSQMLKAVAPDGVIVCTPTEFHLEPTLAALEAGADVLIEKPITATKEEARRIVDRAGELGRQVLVGHHRRHTPVLARARQIIQGGDIGDLVTVNGQWTVKKDDAYFAPEWRKRRAAGPVLTNLIHEIDTLRHLCGEVKSISAELSNAPRGFEKEDSAAVVMGFVNGAIGTFILSDATPSPWTWEQATGENPVFPPAHRNTHRFTGTGGALEFPGLAIWKQVGEHSSWHDGIESRPVESATAEAFVRQCAHFCAVIRGDEPPLVTAQDGARTLAVTLAVFEAAQIGRRVVL